MNVDEAAALLGVSATSQPDEIKSAFRRRAHAIHPDRFEDGSEDQATAHRQFLLAVQARDLLTSRREVRSAASEQRSHPKAMPDMESVYIAMGSLAKAAHAFHRSTVARIGFWVCLVPGVAAALASEDVSGQALGNALNVTGVVLISGAVIAAVVRRFYAHRGTVGHHDAVRVAYTTSYYEAAMYLNSEAGVSGPLDFYRTISVHAKASP